MLEINVLEDIINDHFEINLKTRLKSKKSITEYSYRAGLIILIHIANKNLGFSHKRIAERYDRPADTVRSSFYYKNKDMLFNELRFDYKTILDRFNNETKGFIAVREDMEKIKDILDQTAELNYKMIKSSHEMRELMESFEKITKKYKA